MSTSRVFGGVSGFAVALLMLASVIAGAVSAAIPAGSSVSSGTSSQTIAVIPLQEFIPIADMDPGFDASQIHVGQYSFAPGKAPAISSALSAPPNNDVFIVRFDHSVDQATVDRLTAQGIEVLDFVPYFSVLARAPVQKMATLGLDAHVTWFGDYQPAYKFGEPRSELAKAGAYDVMFFGGARDRDAAALATASGLQILSYMDNVGSADDLAVMTGPISALDAALGSPLVKSAYVNKRMELVDRFDLSLLGYSGDPIANSASPEFVKLLNDRSRGVAETTVVWYADTNGYHKLLMGENIIVGVQDTGFDTGNPATALDDFRSGPLGQRVVKSPNNDADGHGTHVAGTVLGNGFNSEKSLGLSTTDRVYDLGYAGEAPEAKLVIHGGGLGTQNFNSMVTDGAKFISNSWGPVGSYGTYDSTSSTVDTLQITNPGVMVLFAAGNDGPKANTVGSGGGGTWNGITVCASVNDRPEDGSVDPNQVASFSGRGPFQQGNRIKPDLCHIGTSVYSTKSTAAPAAAGDLDKAKWDANGDLKSDYTSLQGTSMACPNMAGSAAVVRDYLIDVKAIADPEAQLVKALLVAGAVNMGYGFPSNDQGFGRVNVRNSVSPPAPRSNQFVTNNLTATGVWTPAGLNLDVKSGNTPVKVTLVWSNTANAALQNNLDLTVTAPGGGAVYKGNKFTAGTEWSAAGATGSDTENNIEVVQVQNPPTGVWTVSVNAAAVSGTAKAALVFSADVGPDLEFKPHAKMNGQFHFIVKQSATAQAMLNVTNFGKQADSIALAANGAPAGMVTFTPPGPLSLASGASQTVTIAIAAGTNTAKAYPIDVVATSGNDPATPKTISKTKLNVDVIVTEYGTTVPITTASPRSDFDPAIVAFKDSTNKEHVFVAWTSTSATGERVFLRHSADGGITWGAEMQVSTLDDGPTYLRMTYMPDTGAAHKGRVALTWTGTEPGTEDGFWTQFAFADPANYDNQASWSGSIKLINKAHGNQGGSAYNPKRTQVPLAVPSTGEFINVFETLDYTAKPSGNTNPVSVTNHVFRSADGGTTWAEQNHYEVSGQYLFFPNAVIDNGGNVQVYFYARGGGAGGDDRDLYASIRTGATWSCGGATSCKLIWDTPDSLMFPAADTTQEGANTNRVYVGVTKSATSESDKKFYMMYTDDDQATFSTQKGPFAGVVARGAYITGPVLDVDSGLAGTAWRTHVSYMEATNAWISPQAAMTWSEDGFTTKTDQLITTNSLAKGHHMSASIGGKVFTTFFMRNPVDYNMDVYVTIHGTGGGGGNITPLVTLTAPVDAQTNVPVNSNIEITFNTPMDTAVTQAAITSVPAIAGTFTWSNGDTKVVLDPATDMAAGALHTVTVSIAAKSKAGVAMAAPKVFSFTTAGGGGNIPTVTATPANSATNVAINTNIVLTFTQPMDTAVTLPAVSLAPVAANTPTWSAGDTVLTLDPNADLAVTTPYTITVTIAAKSKAGVAMAAQFTSTFTTGTGTGPTPPKVLSNTPGSAATNVPRNTDVVINFDLAMDKVATEGAFSIAPPAPGAVTWSNADATMTYNPTADLAASTEYTVTVSTAAKSAAGANLATAHSFKFTTGTVSDATPPAIGHTPLATIEEGTALDVKATVTDDIKVDSVILKYKVAGGASFKSMAMPKTSGDEYAAKIPGTDVKVDKVEYYIEAVDSAARRTTEPANAPTGVHTTVVTKKGPVTPPSDPLGGMLIPLILIIVVAVVVALVVVMMMKKKKTPPTGMPPQMGGYPQQGGPQTWQDPNQQWQQPPQGGQGGWG